MKLTYWSHSCVLLETATHRLVIDPFLTGNPLAPVQAVDVRCDYVLVTHGHNDHVGDAAQIAQRNGATIIANYETAMFLGGQGAQVHPMNIGGSHRFPFGTVKFTIAHHGSGYETESGILYMGNPVGMLITADGKTVYHAGDTALFLDMQLIGQRHPIDLALLPIGDNFTMGIDDAVAAVEFLKPKLAVPIHYRTFGLIDVDPAEFQTKCAASGFAARVVEIGQTITVG